MKPVVRATLFLAALTAACGAQAQASQPNPNTQASSNRAPQPLESGLEVVDSPLPDRESINWTADCAMGALKFGLRFHTDSPGPDEDDMRVFFERPGKASIALPLPPAWYSARSLTSNARSLCRNATAFAVGERVLLWLSVNDRPDWDQLALVLLDPRSGQVLDQRFAVGPIKGGAEDGERTLVVRERGGGHDVRLVREWLQDSNNDGPGNSIEDWMRVRVVGDSIVTDWKNPG